MAGRLSKPDVVVVTGASAGLGRAIVRAFAREGAHLGLIARGYDGLEAARREVEEAGGRALVLPLDVADAGAVELAAEEVERELGPIDVWVNNAMVSVFSPVREMRPEEYTRVTEVTYLGYIYGTLAALKRMLPRDRGTIIQVGSALAYRGIPLQLAYCAAKHAVQGFHDSLLAELIHERSSVRVTMVQMPALNTPQFSWVKSRLPREAQPVRFLDAHEARTLAAVAERIVPQPDRGAGGKIPIVSWIDEKLYEDRRDGYRYEGLPPQREAWRLGLRGIDEATRALFGTVFVELAPCSQDIVLTHVRRGNASGAAWELLPAARFFESVLSVTIVRIYYAHPLAWNEIGYGGPSSPRGYVRKREGDVDPWEAQEG